MAEFNYKGPAPTMPLAFENRDGFGGYLIFIC